MAISFEKFLAWAETRFGDVSVKGNEIRINSPFAEDYKKHLWANPYGGKKGAERPYGVYRLLRRWKLRRQKAVRHAHKRRLQMLERPDASAAHDACRASPA